MVDCRRGRLHGRYSFVGHDHQTLCMAQRCSKQAAKPNLQQACGFTSLCSYVQQHGPNAGACICQGSNVCSSPTGAPIVCSARLRGNSQYSSPCCELLDVFLKPMGPSSSLVTALCSGTNGSRNRATAGSIQPVQRADILRAVRIYLLTLNSALSEDCSAFMCTI